MTVPVGYAKGRQKRRELTEQAMVLFGELGYRGASLRELAARCGLSHPGLLHHFPTKQALLLAVLELRDTEDAAWLAAGDPTGLGPLRRLIELVELNAGRRAIVELYSVLSAEATSVEHPAHAYFVERYRASHALVRHAYQQAAEAGALRDGIDPGLAAHQLVALMDGLQLQWLLDDGATDLAGVVRAHVEAQLR